MSKHFLKDKDRLFEWMYRAVLKIKLSFLQAIGEREEPLSVNILAIPTVGVFSIVLSIKDTLFKELYQIQFFYTCRHILGRITLIVVNYIADLSVIELYQICYPPVSDSYNG